ncbi:hypothetical protein DEO72_LG10g1540 [Vigna unguiculata]|uniref:Uncharacterized protein n=1 Tax=Vigna unguiculata TaxID=3917 RepID=A0A4D6NBP3_VIGUN|nr:hypothetical protein DEO72_LG10g1540 [Vigna unguiculata]
MICAATTPHLDQQHLCSSSTRKRSHRERTTIATIFSVVLSRLHTTTLHCRSAKHFAGAPKPPATPSVHAPVLTGKEDLAGKRQQPPSLHLRSQSVRETLILERESALPRVSI